MSDLYRHDLQQLIKLAPSDFSRVSREIAQRYKMNTAKVRRDAFQLATQVTQQSA